MGNSYSFSKAAISVARGDIVRWRKTSAIQPHDVRSVLPGYFKSPGGAGGMGPGEVFSRTFQQAGSFGYVCRVHQDQGMRGTVTVPITVTRSGSTFTIKVARGSTSGSPWRNRVQVRTPGSSSWKTVATTTAKSVTFASSKPGTYQFRSAVRNKDNGAQVRLEPGRQPDPVGRPRYVRQAARRPRRVDSMPAMRRPMLSVVMTTVMLAATLTPAAAAAPPSVDVTIRSMRYDPVSLVVPQGTSVRWSNVTSPSRAHDVVSSLPGLHPQPADGERPELPLHVRCRGHVHVCLLHPRRHDRLGRGAADGCAGDDRRRPYFRVTLGPSLLPQAVTLALRAQLADAGRDGVACQGIASPHFVVLATTPGTYQFRARLKDKVGHTRSADTPLVTMEFPAQP